MRRKNRRGTSCRWWPFAVAVMFGFVAVAIDMGRLAVAKAQCQNAADAAAIAGARTLDGSTSQTSRCGKHQRHRRRDGSQVLAADSQASEVTGAARGVPLRYTARRRSRRSSDPLAHRRQLQPYPGHDHAPGLGDLLPYFRRSAEHGHGHGDGRPPAAQRGHRAGLLRVDEQRERPVEQRKLPGHSQQQPQQHRPRLPASSGPTTRRSPPTPSCSAPAATRASASATSPRRCWDPRRWSTTSTRTTSGPAPRGVHLRGQHQHGPVPATIT